ncbi:acyltransferase family protein [Brucella anthropi]|uniref:acyltransferase family protein n=1 Tax=Brucella anthropi TaxID=529 RepID=UPI003D98D5FD
MTSQSQGKIEYADTLRGIAAVCVLVAHYYGVYWGDKGAVAALIHAPAANLTEEPFPRYLLWLHSVPHFNWGAFGVALFFIVSGFVIPFSLRNRSWQAFLVGRFFRIVPLYVVGFSITLISIFVVGRYFGVDWPFSVSEILTHYIPGMRDLFGTQNIDGIIWTLEIEVKFYLICALGAACFRSRSVRVFLLPVFIIALALLSNMLIYNAPQLTNFASRLVNIAVFSAPHLVYMFIGVAFHFVHIGQLRKLSASLIGLFLFAAFMSLIYVSPYYESIILAWNYGLAVFVFAFAARFQNIFHSNTVTRFFSRISYPLYTVHGVTGYVAFRILGDIGIPSTISIPAVTTGILMLSWLLHVAVEAPFDEKGKKIARRFNRTDAFKLAPAE